MGSAWGRVCSWLTSRRVGTIACVLLVFSINSCVAGARSGFVDQKGRPTAAPWGALAPDTVRDSALIIIWNHGSREPHQRDRCPGVPPLVRALEGERLGPHTVHVYHACHAHLRSSWDLQTGAGLRKLDKRILELEALLEAFQARGVRPGQVILAGQSCGAWTGLLLAVRRPDLMAGQIAFSPACHGALNPNLHCAAVGKPECATILADRRRQVGHLMAADSLDALVYSFPGDPFAPRGSLGFLDFVPGIERHRPVVGPPGKKAHFLVWEAHFPEAEQARIRRYVGSRPAG